MAGLAGWIAWLFGLDYTTAQIVTASLIVSLFAILLVRLAYPRPRQREASTTTSSKDSSAGEPRIVDLTMRGSEKSQHVLTEALASETAKLLEKALKYKLVQPVLVSPQCPPNSRVLLDPVNQEIICIDADSERGAKIAKRLGPEVKEEIIEPGELDRILDEKEVKLEDEEKEGGEGKWE